MAMHGETIHLGASSQCDECGAALENQVLESAAGYYIGTSCCSGPYSRESGYYSTRVEVVALLAADTWQRRNAEYKPAPLSVKTPFKITIEGIRHEPVGTDSEVHSLFTVSEERALEIHEMLVEEYMSLRGGA